LNAVNEYPGNMLNIPGYFYGQKPGAAEKINWAKKWRSG
jgi:hypothetical protein